MNIDEEFMKIALEEANIAFQEDEVPVGCVIVKGGKIIARGHNTKEKDTSIFSHAEINAIKQAQKELGSYILTDCDVYVTLEPCPMCASSLQQARVHRIIYGAKDIKNGACGGLFDLFLIPNLNYYPFLSSQVLEVECRNILTKYFSNKR